MSRQWRDWRIQAIAFLLLGCGLAVFFITTSVDLQVARYFHAPGAAGNPWPMGQQFPWALTNALAPWITGSLLIAALAAGLMGLRNDSAAWKRRGLYVFLSLAIGPGLIVNSVFKDNWGRSRPRDLVEFGGANQFTAAPMRGDAGRSFPCGDSSVGFLCAIGWWIWRRRRPRWALISLGFGVSAGVLIGYGRMAAGGHFLSDILWSGFMVLGAAHLLYPLTYRATHVPALISVGEGRTEINRSEELRSL